MFKKLKNLFSSKSKSDDKLLKKINKILDEKGYNQSPETRLLGDELLKQHFKNLTKEFENLTPEEGRAKIERELKEGKEELKRRAKIKEELKNKNN